MPEKSVPHRRTATGGVSALAERVLELLASGQASTRTELAGLLGAAPSTISLTVGQLVAHGLVAEEGTRSSNGGRPQKVLRLGGSDGFAVAAELGGRHAHVGVVLPGGGLTDVSTVPFPTADGPESALPGLAGTLESLADRHGRHLLRGVGLSLPGPVDVVSGVVTLPSRMPGWNRFPVRSWLEDHFGVPAAIENDANCMAVGEHTVQPRNAASRSWSRPAPRSARASSPTAGSTGADPAPQARSPTSGSRPPTTSPAPAATPAAWRRSPRAPRWCASCANGASTSTPPRTSYGSPPTPTPRRHARSGRRAATSAWCSPPTSTSSTPTRCTSAASSPRWNRSSPPSAVSSTRAAIRW